LSGDDGAEVLDAFKDFLGSGDFSKAYHDFADARRALLHASGAEGLAEGAAERADGRGRSWDPAEGADSGGFEGDTMQMARLWDPSLARDYELNFLAGKLLGPDWNGGSAMAQIARVTDVPVARMKKLSLAEVQRDDKTRESWIDVSSFAAAATYYVHKQLAVKLGEQRWLLEGPVKNDEVWKETAAKTMWDYYKELWLPFGRLLSDMELRGVPADRQRLDELICIAEDDKQTAEAGFRDWVRKRAAKGSSAEDADWAVFNIDSGLHLRQVLYGQRPLAVAVKSQDAAPEEASGDEEDEGSLALDHQKLNSLKVPELKQLCKERKLKVGGKKSELVERVLVHDLSQLSRSDLTERCHELELPVDDGSEDEALVRQIAAAGKAPPPPRAACGLIPGLGLAPPEGFTTKKKGEQQITSESLKALRDEQSEALGEDGVAAIDHLLRYREVTHMLNSFLAPMRGWSQRGRVHASFGLNTETGRLSSRNPNLMAASGDTRIPFREVFAASKGNMLICADYSQVELRVVAHLADCKAMIASLSSGGDIHSDTAYRMFEDVREAVDSGKYALDSSHGDGLPLVKDHFFVQRQRAKILNFSLLYGKTAFSLANEWGTGKAEAEEIINRWFNAFPEIRDWCEKAKADASKGGCARTLLGRARPLPGIRDANQWMRQHAERAAMNTPVQGSAADIVAAAMLRFENCDRLRNELGFRQVLQIHDEVVLEGPEEHAHAACEEVVRLMEDPLLFRLSVPLKVDARVTRTWHEGKHPGPPPPSA